MTAFFTPNFMEAGGTSPASAMAVGVRGPAMLSVGLASALRRNRPVQSFAGSRSLNPGSIGNDRHSSNLHAFARRR